MSQEFAVPDFRGYPKDLAAEQSLSVMREFLIEHQQPELVRFVLFDPGSFGAFTRALKAMAELVGGQALSNLFERVGATR